jgi:hypothetical protein
MKDLLTISFPDTPENREILRMLVHSTDSAARWAGEEMLKNWFNEKILPRLRHVANDIDI